MEKCCFRTAKGCSGTTYETCPAQCAFRKTQKEYDEGVAHAARLLREKGLVKVEKNVGRKKVIVTVEKAGGACDVGRKNPKDPDDTEKDCGS